jgi:hypothetical protein
MKISGLLFSALFAATCCSQAQVSVDISLSQDQFLAGEAMPVTVRVVNRSGQTLHFGNDPDWLTFSVESKDSYIITKKGDVPVDDADFVLGSSKQGRLVVDLAPYFSFSRPGRYTVTASVTIKAWNQQVSSAPKTFDIVIGSKMWEQEFGLPKSPGATNESPEMRRYALHQANYLRSRLMLYVQITDDTGKVYKVFPIGPLLSFGRPEPQVDRFSNLHVLYQDGPRSYSHTVVDPHGTVLIRHAYDMGSRPRLKVNSEGNLEVEGGIRRVKSTDVPPPTPPDNNAQTDNP